MWEIFLKSLNTVLVVYALVDIISKTFVLVFRKKPTISDDVFVVIRVKNQEQNLECIIRSVIWKNLSRTGGGRVPNILVVDLGSEDATPEIAQRLCDDYGFIYYTTEEQYNGMKDAFFR
ncbi:MAG: glycosyltransferase [Ruminococcaceae bacterium]|nr:glycosyltransferase [Oscillospiraceae bacterium]